MDTALRIGAKFEAGKGAAEKVLNPRTGKLIVEVPEASNEQVDNAVFAADAAFDQWSRTTPAERSGLLLKLADKIESDADAYADLEALNCGKPRHLVLNDEIPGVVDCFRFFAGAVRTMHGPVAGEYLAGFTSMIRRDPVGVVAQVAPWNYPLMMAAWKLAPALAAGNTVVLKPSEQTPLTALKLAQHIAEIFPEGVCNIINGRGASVGDHDLVKPALERAGGTIDFWKIRMRPGKPLICGRLGDAIFLGLPGNPVSAFVTATLFLLPQVRHMSGCRSPLPVLRKAVLRRKMPAVGGRDDYVRGVVTDGGVEPLSVQDSAATLALARANCLILRPAGAGPAKAVDAVEVVEI